MNAEREQLIQLFEAKAQSFEAPERARFHALLPFQEGILRLRSKKASCRAIAGLLKQLGVTVSHNTIARYCREQSASAAPKAPARAQIKSSAPVTSKPRPSAVAQLLSRPHDSEKHSNSEATPHGRGPRIADPRNV